MRHGCPGKAVVMNSNPAGCAIQDRGLTDHQATAFRPREAEYEAECTRCGIESTGTSTLYRACQDRLNLPTDPVAPRKILVRRLPRLTDYYTATPPQSRKAKGPPHGKGPPREHATFTPKAASLGARRSGYRRVRVCADLLSDAAVGLGHLWRGRRDGRVHGAQLHRRECRKRGGGWWRRPGLGEDPATPSVIHRSTDTMQRCKEHGRPLWVYLTPLR